MCPVSKLANMKMTAIGVATISKRTGIISKEPNLDTSDRNIGEIFLQRILEILRVCWLKLYRDER